MNKLKEGLPQEAFGAMARALLRTLPETVQTGSLKATLEALFSALSRSHEKGSICAKITDIDEKYRELTEVVDAGLACLMTDSPFFGQGGGPQRPLVWDKAGGRVYFEQQFALEMKLARRLVSFARAGGSAPPVTQDQDGAVVNALCRRFSVICGGPGTGKTTTVARILEQLLQQNPALTVALMAPTGKAATRIRESILNTIGRNPASFSQLSRAVDQGRVEEHTIQKWLLINTKRGTRPGPGNPLSADIVIVDEASMIDISLAARLLDAVDLQQNRLIILGDAHQLSAVGPGAVFADLCAEPGILKGTVTRLTHSFRFAGGSPIGKLAAAINTGDKEGVAAAFALPEKDGEFVRRENTGASFVLPRPVRDWLDRAAEEYAAAVARWAKPLDAGEAVPAGLIEAAWRAFNAHRPLAAQRRGPLSLAVLNEYLSERVATLLRPHFPGVPFTGDLYPGSPLIVRRNNDLLGVFNGDVAILVPDGAGSYDAYFGDGGRTVKAVLLSDTETAYALTIHQSQGSEYPDVAVFLPADESSGLATRELIYTGVTRAKKSVMVFSGDAPLSVAVATRTERDGALCGRIEALSAAQGTAL